MQGHSEALYKEDEFPHICVFPFLCAILGLDLSSDFQGEGKSS